MAKIKILVLDRGFVVIALMKPHPTRAFWFRARTRTIRLWGTTNGLGQLAGGPTGKTVLDDMVTENIPHRAILREIDVEAEPWKHHLSAPPQRQSAGDSSTPTGSKRTAGAAKRST